MGPSGILSQSPAALPPVLTSLSPHPCPLVQSDGFSAHSALSLNSDGPKQHVEGDPSLFADLPFQIIHRLPVAFSNAQGSDVSYLWSPKSSHLVCPQPP